MQIRILITVSIAITLLFTGTSYAATNSCATVDAELNVQLPCVSAGGSFYQVELLKTTNPADMAGLYWSLGNFSLTSDNGACATTNNNLDLQVSCVNVSGTTFKANLNYTTLDGAGNYWKYISANPIVGQMNSLTDVENQLLARINQERNGAGLPTLIRDPGLDWIIYWHVTGMATDHFLGHDDANNRRGEARARYYSGESSVRCSEIIQWWGGTPDGDTHYTGYFNSPPHHSAYMEEGIYNLGPTTHVGVAGLSATGPTGSSYDGNSGSYTGVFFCNKPLTLIIDPFSE